MLACLCVMVLAATAVEKELATSLAPVFFFFPWHAICFCSHSRLSKVFPVSYFLDHIHSWKIKIRIHTHEIRIYLHEHIVSRSWSMWCSCTHILSRSLCTHQWHTSRQRPRQRQRQPATNTATVLPSPPHLRPYQRRLSIAVTPTTKNEAKQVLI